MAKKKVTKPGQPCPKCGKPVEKRVPKKKPSRSGQPYVYDWYLYCRPCKSMYHVEEAKRWQDKDHPLYIQEQDNKPRKGRTAAKKSKKANQGQPPMRIIPIEKYVDPKDIRREREAAFELKQAEEARGRKKAEEERRRVEREKKRAPSASELGNAKMEGECAECGASDERLYLFRGRGFCNACYSAEELKMVKQLSGD